MIDRIEFSRDELERMLEGKTVTTLKVNGEVLAFNMLREELQ